MEGARKRAGAVAGSGAVAGAKVGAGAPQRNPPFVVGGLAFSGRWAMSAVAMDCYRQDHPCWKGLRREQTKRYQNKGGPSPIIR